MEDLQGTSQGKPIPLTYNALQDLMDPSIMSVRGFYLRSISLLESRVFNSVTCCIALGVLGVEGILKGAVGGRVLLH